MDDLSRFVAEHRQLTRRYLLGLGVAGAATLVRGRSAAAADEPPALLAAEIAKLKYLTEPDAFGTVERGNPLPYKQPLEKLREIGLTRDTWKLEVVADPAAPAKLGAPLSKDLGTALDWDGLMRLAERHAVRYLKIMTCNNVGSPLGMGLWEGVPLRTIVWLTKPESDCRRLFYYGAHNDDPQQRFQSSLPIGRVLEDPPGMRPVIVCYKLNGEFLSGKRGGPVRIIVPEAYGFKSVKWLQRIVLTNAPYANDTYASGNNDVDSHLKTFARFLSQPETVKFGAAAPVTGMAQVGISGLQKVQTWLQPHDATWPADDPYFTQAPWRDAEILAPPKAWGGGLPDGQLPADVADIDPQSQRPTSWPLRLTLAHWAALLTDIPVGKYQLRCRTIDAHGIAQPMPRPFAKSGRNSIAAVELNVVPA